MSTTVQSRRERDLKAIFDRVRTWYDEILRDKPNLEDGFAHELKLYGGCEGSDDDGEPFVNVRATCTKDEWL